jgi:hypothetical protein
MGVKSSSSIDFGINTNASADNIIPEPKDIIV